MTTEALAPELSPSESAYFESGGKTEIEATTATGADKPGDSVAADASLGGEQTQKPTPAEVIDKKAFDAERTRRKTAETERRNLETQLAELRGKFAVIEQLRSGGPQEQSQELTPELDIFGYAKKTSETVSDLQKRLDAQDAAARQENERNQIVSAYRADVGRFAESNTDFGDAYRHLLVSRANELKAMGYEDERAIHDALIADEMEIAKIALSKGGSPAELIYSLAAQRGYKKAEAAQKPGAAEKLDTIERGQNANKSLSNAGGASGDGDMTAAMLLKLPNDEFEAWCRKYPAKAKGIFGG